MKKHMKKLISLVLVGLMLLGATACGNSNNTPTETKAAQNATKPVGTESNAGNSGTSGREANTMYRSSIAEGVGDKVEYPWHNISFIPSLMYRTLFLAETDLTTLKPDLASGYTVSDDGLVYTIDFIGGSKWSDGEEITTDDVVFSIQTNLKASVSNGIFTAAFGKIAGADAWRSGEADSIEGIAVDGNTITITLTTPHNSFPQVLAQFAILPQHSLADVDPLSLNTDNFWSNPVSSGMFRLGEMNPGNYFVLVQNEYYDGTKPKIEKIVNYFCADYITAAQAGQLDFFNTNASDLISEISKLDYMTMYPVDILFYRYFICNMSGVDGNENPVMQDPRVRQAIMYAIDRETLATQLFPDLAHPIHSGVPTDNADCNGVSFEYNPEKAKELLNEAGYDFNRTFRILYYYSDQASVDFMQAIAYYLGEVGMKVEVTQSSNSTQDLFQTRDYDIGYKGLSAFDISEWYNEYSSTNANFQNIFGGDPAFDALLTELAACTTADQRSDVLTRMQNLEQEMLYKLPLYTIGNNIFINTDHIKIPEGTTFGNPWYKSDIGFENWEAVA